MKESVISVMVMVTSGIMIVIGVVIYVALQQAVNTTTTPASTVTILNLVPLAIAGIGILQMLIAGLSA